MVLRFQNQFFNILLPSIHSAIVFAVFNVLFEVDHVFLSLIVFLIDFILKAT